MSSRRVLSSSLDAQALVAAKSLSALSNSLNERLDVAYPLSAIKPSKDNPRRHSLDLAGVTSERVAELSIQESESFEGWVARLEAFLSAFSESESNKPLLRCWVELFDLATNLHHSELLQPIVINQDGIIIAGERRWVALQLAGKKVGRVITRNFAAEDEHLYRLIENLKRSDLTVAETVSAVRNVISAALGVECGPNADAISIAAIQKVLGGGHTQASYYRAVCRLSEHDPMLAKIMHGDFGGIRAVYEAIQSSSKAPEKSEAKAVERPQKEPAPYPTFKARIPSTTGGIKIISALAQIQGISEQTMQKLDDVLMGWTGAPEKVRVQMLSEILQSVSVDLDALDVPSAEGEQGA